MTPTWTFTDFEFFVMCRAQEHEHVPPPFVFRSGIATSTEFDEVARKTLDELRTRWDPQWDGMVDTLVHHDIRLIIDAWDEGDADRQEGIVRVLATRRGDRGYVIRQRPGRTFWHGGGFTVAECPALELASAAVDLMPEVKPGSRREVVLSTDKGDDGLDYSYGRSAVRDSFADSMDQSSEEFLKTPTERVGSISVIQGRSLFGPRGITKHRLGWRDLVDDGRYVIDDRTPPVAMPASSRRLTEMINTRIAAVVRAIKDERV
ncbi:ESX secretion-associated protein EspG [Nocardia shimofusensis]|uniref:ESX secretion-associated protein EspG n=1 Tax=Nocardia shimofusensis TaxID=228596 RepID=UPI0008366D7B|nr:ESX secretion-associated protein EspG [Nocardia shimofusensis]